MFASLAFLAAAQLSPIVIPFGNPRQVERPVAPLATAGPAFAEACAGADGTEPTWDKPAPPVRIHGNSYFVGTCGISAILITGRAGHILIDAGTERGADLIAANVRSLGFRLQDVKILLHSHEHIDHVGGMSRLQRLTGARLLASPVAAKVFASGAPTPDDPQAGLHPIFPSARVDRMVRDGETVRLGDLALTAVATPGHTAGALSWHWGTCDGGNCRRLVYADSLSAISRDDYRFRDHPVAVSAFRAGLGKLATLECDILLTPHPSASRMIERFGGKSPLVNAAACRDYAAAKAKALDERLAKEAASK